MNNSRAEGARHASQHIGVDVISVIEVDVVPVIQLGEDSHQDLQ